MDHWKPARSNTDDVLRWTSSVVQDVLLFWNWRLGTSGLVYWSGAETLAVRVLRLPDRARRADVFAVADAELRDEGLLDG